MLGRFWAYLTTKCQTCSRIRLGIGVAVVAVLVAGVLMAAGAAGLAWTNTEKFCISCHEMRDNVYAEFKDTIHDKNRSGVRAVCSDCHVPREPVAMLMRKAAATFEIWGKITGVINTKEKYEKHRHAMAVSVWTEMKRNDSRECRHCHTPAKMDPERQSDAAKAKHAPWRPTRRAKGANSTGASSS